MNRKQIREAVRGSIQFKIKSFLGLVPTEKDYTFTKYYAKAWMTKPRLSSEEQILYLTSKAIFFAQKGDFYNSYQYFRMAYLDSVEDVERESCQNKIWQNLTERERSNIRLKSYSRASDEAESEREYVDNQKEIMDRSYSLSNGSTKPEYNFPLLKRLRSGLKYWQRQQLLHPKRDCPDISIKEIRRFREKLDQILNN